MAERILIAEDDLYQRAMLAGHLAEMDCVIEQSSTSADALAWLASAASDSHSPDLAIVSTRLKGHNGAPLYREIIHRHPEVPVVLISDRRSMGDAVLAMREGAYDYLTKPFESLDDVGLRVSRALERARLVRENREFRAAIEYDLEIARTVQERFLPSDFPLPDRVSYGAHYTACSGVGGDLYDVLALDDEHLGAYIFDVSGHGASAALITSILKISFHAFIEKSGPAHASGDDPTLVAMSYLNPVLKRLTTSTQFATMIYAMLDLDGQRLAFTSAGHCYPILIDPAGHATYVKPRQGPPLGVLASVTYQQDWIEFIPGSTIVVYTDGINEAYSPGGEQWGLERMLQSVEKRATVDGSRRTPQQIVDGLIADMQTFTRNTPNRDDVTALAIRFEG